MGQWQEAIYTRIVDKVGTRPSLVELVALEGTTSVLNYTGDGTQPHGDQASTTEKTEQAPPAKKPTGIPKADLEQITGQELRQQFPGPPVRITCPDDLPARVGASTDCVVKRYGDAFRLTITITSVTSPTDANWSFTLGEKVASHRRCN